MINASNRTTENILINQTMKNKRPTFNEAFNKINKHTMNKTSNDPLNIIHSNEQLYKYYVKETMPLLDVSNETFGDKKSNMFNNTNNNDNDNTNNTMKKMMRLMGLIDDEDDDRKDFKTMEGSVNTLPLQSSDGVNFPSSAVDIPKGRIQLVLTTEEINDIIKDYDEGAVVLLNEIFERLMMPDIVNDDIYDNFIDQVNNTSFSYILDNTIQYKRAINDYLNNIFTPDDLKDDMINQKVIDAIYGDGTYEYINALYISDPDLTDRLTVRQILEKYTEIVPKKELIPEEEREMTTKEKKAGRRQRNRKNKDDETEDIFDELRDNLEQVSRGETNRKKKRKDKDKDDAEYYKILDTREVLPAPIKEFPQTKEKRKRGAPIKQGLPQTQMEKNRNKRIEYDVDTIIRTEEENRSRDENIIALIAREKAGDNIKEFNRIFEEDLRIYQDNIIFNTFG